MCEIARASGSMSSITRLRNGANLCDRLFSPVEISPVENGSPPVRVAARDQRPVLCDSWTGGPGVLYTDGTIGQMFADPFQSELAKKGELCHGLSSQPFLLLLPAPDVRRRVRVRPED